MLIQTSAPVRSLLCAGLLVIGFLASGLSALAQSNQSGVIRGKVLNASTGNYLNNARITVPGTNLETSTSSTGDYWLSNVPPGEVTVVAEFTGIARQEATVTVAPGTTATQDFTLRLATEVGPDGDVIVLDTLTVESRVLSGQAIALMEQKNAPNIKNVISLDEYVDMADGNIGEFLKYIPGVDIEYNPFYPTSAGIRGMPASGTLIQYDGVSLAVPSVAGNRNFDLTTAASANVDRLEVSKVPTPDMPANAVGGSINVITKSGFIRKDPLFTYKLYTTYNARRSEFDPSPSFSKLAGPDDMASWRPVQFAYDLSYLLPIKDKVAFSFGLTRSPRYQEAEFLTQTWELNPTRELLVANGYFGEYISAQTTSTISAGADWNINRNNTLKASYYSSERVGLRRQSRVRWITSLASRTGDTTSTTGTGAAQQAPNWQTQHRELDAFSLIYRHDGPVWKFDASASISEGKYYSPDTADGHFGTVLAQTPNNNWVISGHDAIFYNPGRVPEVTATAVSGGAPFDIYDGNSYPIASVTSNNDLLYLNESRSAGINVAREFDTAIPTTIKVGALWDENERDGVTYVSTWNFRPNGSSAVADRMASNFDVLMPSGYHERSYFTTISGEKKHTTYISPRKVYELYQANPSWFVLNESAQYINRVNGSQEVSETITAGYVRMDNRFLNNRLRVTTGIRYERTEDEGSGPLNDISATYQRNPDGSFVTNPDGSLVPITTDALERAKLQYTERGASKTTNYDGFYPSVNTSYDLGEHFVIRAAYAHTIGRPQLSNIIPSTTISDPDDIDLSNPDDSGTIRIIDGELKPWSANNYDLTFEAYDFKGMTASVSLFRKDVEDFFTTREEPPTPQLISELGIPADLGTLYRVVRTVNSGSAELSGLELSYRQQLSFLPGLGRRFHVYANFTKQNVSGPDADDFLRIPDKMARAGISYIDRKFIAKLSVSYEDFLKLGTSATGNHTYLSPSTRWDVSAEYRINKRIAVFFSVRNLTSEPQKRSVINFDLPSYSYPREWRYLPASYTLGIKGTF